MKLTTKFYLTPSIFLEVENGNGRFTIAWLFIYLDIYFTEKKMK